MNSNNLPPPPPYAPPIYTSNPAAYFPPPARNPEANANDDEEKEIVMPPLVQLDFNKPFSENKHTVLKIETTFLAVCQRIDTYKKQNKDTSQLEMQRRDLQAHHGMCLLIFRGMSLRNNEKCLTLNEKYPQWAAPKSAAVVSLSVEPGPILPYPTALVRESECLEMVKDSEKMLPIEKNLLRNNHKALKRVHKNCDGNIYMNRDRDVHVGMYERDFAYSSIAVVYHIYRIKHVMNMLQKYYHKTYPDDYPEQPEEKVAPARPHT